MSLATKATKMERCTGCGNRNRLGVGFASHPSAAPTLEINLCLRCLRALHATAWDARHTLDDVTSCVPCSKHYARASPCRFRRIVCSVCRLDDITNVGRSHAHFAVPPGFRVMLHADGHGPGAFVCSRCFETMEPARPGG